MKHWTRTYRTHADVIFQVDADVYQNVHLTRREVDKVANLLARTGAALEGAVLDLACGTGRHSIEMATRGCTVTGMDRSPRFIIRARHAAGRLPIQFVLGDMRNLDREFHSRSFSKVTLLGNSFGFFDDSTNRHILQQIHEVLKRGGYFVFDGCDRALFLRELKPYDFFVVQTPSFGKVLDERWRAWYPKENLLKCRKRHSAGDEVLLDTTYELRLYELSEFSLLVRELGFRLACMDAFMSEADVGAMSSRMFFVCQKP
jgi:D-alanine-D-alanine ligase